MSITLRQLSYFTAVAERESITAAARELYVSQSSISSAISDLERTLGVKLFVRHARGLSVSREGKAILPRARRLLRDVRDLELTAGDLTSAVSGTLNVGCYTTLAPVLIPRIIAQLAEKHPNLDVHFTEGSRSDIVNDFINGRHDVIVLYDYNFKNDLPAIGETTRLGAFPAYVLLSPDHQLASSDTVSLNELIDEPYISFGLEPAEEYFLSIFSALGIQPNRVHSTPNHEVLRGLVARGLGYSLMTQKAGHKFSHEGLPYVTTPLRDEHEHLAVVAVTPEKPWRTEKVTAFLDVALDTVRLATSI